MGGTEMLATAAGTPDFAVVRAYDVSPAATDRARTAHPDVVFTTDAREVVGSQHVDAVYIATPPMFHAEPAIAAMRAGKAVFCGNPGRSAWPTDAGWWRPQPSRGPPKR